MKCPRCGSENVNVTLEQDYSRTSYNSRGCLWTICRWFLIFCTCGLWLLVGRSKGRSKTKYHNKTIAICQNCAKTWSVK